MHSRLDRSSTCSPWSRRPPALCAEYSTDSGFLEMPVLGVAHHRHVSEDLAEDRAATSPRPGRGPVGLSAVRPSPGPASAARSGWRSSRGTAASQPGGRGADHEQVAALPGEAAHRRRPVAAGGDRGLDPSPALRQRGHRLGLGRRACSTQASITSSSPRTSGGFIVRARHPEGRDPQASPRCARRSRRSRPASGGTPRHPGRRRSPA